MPHRISIIPEKKARVTAFEGVFIDNFIFIDRPYKE